MISSAKKRYDELPHPTVVVIGGGFAGLNLIHKLRDKPFKVLLVDRNNFHTFQPLLYQVATGSLTADSIAYPFRKSVGPMNNVAFRMANVTAIKPEENTIETDHGTIKYDYLVLATGSQTNFFNKLDVETMAMQLKSISQALDIRSDFLQEFETAVYLPDDEAKIRKYLNFVIVGGGPTGVEVSGALAEIKNQVLRKEYREVDADLMQIWLIDAGERLLNGFSTKSSKAALKFLTEMGVNVKLKTQVVSYDGNTVRFNDGSEMETTTVIWSAGVKGTVIPGLDKAKIVQGNRFETDVYNRVKGYDNIFALGDVASVITEKNPGGNPMVAQVAIQQGKLLAENFLRLIKNQPLKPFIYKDKGSMATIGRHKAVVDVGKIHFSGAIAWYIWMLVHIWALIGFRNRMLVLWNWAWKYLSWNNTIRLIIRPYIRLGQSSEPESPI